MDMKRTLRFITFSCSLLVLLFVFAPAYVFAAGNKEQAVYEPSIQILDSRQRLISLNEPPERIVSLSPNITEILFALGLGDNIVGRTDYCDYPVEASAIPSMGDLFSPSIEMIVASEPSLVILSTLGQSQTIDAIEQTGIPVAFFNEAETLEGTYRLIESVGKITGTYEQALYSTETMRSLVEKIRTIIVGLPKPSVYYVAGFGEWGDFTATGDTFINDLITIAGATNIAENGKNWMFQAELILENDPEIIILPPSWGSTFELTHQQFSTMEPYKHLQAVKNGKIYPFDNGMLERQGPRSALAVLNLAKLFHPSIQWETIE